MYFILPLFRILFTGGSINVTGSVWPSRSIVEEGENVQIDCVLSQTPRGHLSWLKNNVILPEIYFRSKVGKVCVDSVIFLFSFHQ